MLCGCAAMASARANLSHAPTDKVNAAVGRRAWHDRFRTGKIAVPCSGNTGNPLGDYVGGVDWRTL